MITNRFQGTEPLPVVSGLTYARVLASRELRQMLLPEGLFPGPYEILDYRATLSLDDPDGVRATFRRIERVRFLQDGVRAILDHAWGDGILMTYYRNDAGGLEGSIADGGRRNFVIALKRRMARGETLSFHVERTAMVAFTRADERLETTIDHPIARLQRSIIFPATRPCRRATLHAAGRQVPLRLHRDSSGRTIVRISINQPKAHTPYTIRWSW